MKRKFASAKAVDHQSAQWFIYPPHAKSLTKKIESRTQEPIEIPRLQRWFAFVCRMNIIPNSPKSLPIQSRSLAYWGESLPVRLWFRGFRWKFGEHHIWEFYGTISSILFLAEHLIKIYRTPYKAIFGTGMPRILSGEDRFLCHWSLGEQWLVIAELSPGILLIGWSFFWVFAGSFRVASAKKKNDRGTLAELCKVRAEPWSPMSRSHVISVFSG